eukprot:scaffold10.g2453.t1
MAPRTRGQAAAAAQAAQVRRPRGWAELPPDVLRHVFAAAEELPREPPHDFIGRPKPRAADGDPLSFVDLASCSAACAAWHRALRPPCGGLPMAAMVAGGSTPGKRAWAAAVRPAPVRLRIYGSAACEEEQELLRSLEGKGVLEVECCRAPRCLPDPARFPALRSLTIHSLDWDDAWLACLSGLPHLERLEVAVGARPAQGSGVGAALAAAAPLALPRLPALRELRAFVEPEELNLWGSTCERATDRGGAQVVAGEAAEAAPPAPSRLRWLSVFLSRARVDFCALPSLEAASLWAEALEGAGGLAAAVRLRDLRLGSFPIGFGSSSEFVLGGRPWEVQALTAAPAGLVTLRLRGAALSRAAADALARRGGLRALSALSAASHLEVLDWSAFYQDPSEDDIALLASLPSLRHLLLAKRGHPDASQERALRKAMPRLASLTAGSMMDARGEGAFVEAARRACGDEVAAGLMGDD